MWLQAAAEVPGTLTPPGTGTFTTFHFIVMALLALLALIVIVVGVRRSRARRAAEQRVEQEAMEAGLPPTPLAPDPVELRDTPPATHALDRSALGSAPPAAVNDDFVRPEPVTPSPAPNEPPATRSTLADEPVAAAAPMDASPATVADPGPAPAAAPSPADGPVTQLKGLGPKVAARLAELGIGTVGQIAALDADQAQELDGRLGPFSGRLHRDRWVEQARFLAAGDRAGFEAVFGKL